MSSTNQAAWLPGPAARLQVRDAPLTSPGAGEVLIRNHAVAVNPLDVIKQGSADLMYRWLAYPAVLGEDVAGEVAAVGPDVTRFKVGDRVLAYAMGMEKSRNRAAEGGFQLFTVTLEHLTVPIPTTVSFEEAAVVPLAVTTAAAALFLPDQLGLQLPDQSRTSRGQALLVWGGASSVGTAAIQLASAAGYDVWTTASPSRHDDLRGLGARRSFDYHDDDVVDQILGALGDREMVGALAAVPGGADPALAVLSRSRGNRRLVLTGPRQSLTQYPYGGRPRSRALRLLSQIAAWNVSLQVRARRAHVKAGYVFGSAVVGTPTGRAVFEDYLPDALADGRYRPAPRPLVVGDGLAEVQTALDRYREGVSAAKLVVRV